MKRLLLSLGIVAAAATPVHAAEYEIDPSHSTVGFRIAHLAISSVPGKFTGFSGAISFDAAKVAESSAHATIKVSTIDTEEKKRDEHLRSPDFFDASKFPEMTFKTTNVVPVNAKEFNAHGDLSIHGVTKPVVLRVKFRGEAKDPWGNTRAGFSATTEINRKDFGLGWNKVLEAGGLLVGEEVEIMIDIEAIKKA